MGGDTFQWDFGGVGCGFYLKNQEAQRSANKVVHSKQQGAFVCRIIKTGEKLWIFMS